MYKCDIQQAKNGYILWVNGADNIELLGAHLFSNKEDLMEFIKQHLI